VSENETTTAKEEPTNAAIANEEPKSFIRSLNDSRNDVSKFEI